MDATQEAVQLYRPFAQKHPDTFAPDLATCLNNLSAHLVALRRLEDTLKAAEESVQLYRDLAPTHPIRSAFSLANSLDTLGAVLSALGRWEETLAAGREAVQLFLQFFRPVPMALPAESKKFKTAVGNFTNSLTQVGLDPALDPDWVAARAMLGEAGLL